MIGKVLLIATLALCAFPASMTAGQGASTASREDFNQLLQSAESARNENRDDDAIRLFRRALVKQPESEEALWYLGTLLYEKDAYAESRDLLRQFVALAPTPGQDGRCWG